MAGNMEGFQQTGLLTYDDTAARWQTLCKGELQHILHIYV